MNKMKDILKQLRTDKGATQQELANYINKTRATYCRYEKGTLKPDIDTLMILADYYKVSLDYITGRYD